MDIKIDNLKILIALNDLELFFDQILKDLKIYYVKLRSNELNRLSNQIILLSQNYFSIKKEVRLSLISIEKCREQNNKIIAGLLEIVDELNQNFEFAKYINQDKGLAEKYSFEEPNYNSTGLQIEKGIE